MGFFDRNREQLANKGIDDARLPPGQYLTERFPVLHVGDVPTYAPGQWDLKIFGLVDKPFTINLDELKSMPAVTLLTDKPDTGFHGPAVDNATLSTVPVALRTNEPLAVPKLKASPPVTGNVVPVAPTVMARL